MKPIEIRLNGHPEQVADGCLLADLLVRSGYGPERRGIAVAVNGVVLRRAEWGQYQLRPGDAVELLVAVQGG